MVTLSVITIIMPKMEKPYFTGGSVKKMAPEKRVPKTKPEN